MSKWHEDDQQKVPRSGDGVEERVCADVSRRFDRDGNARQYDSRHERESVPHFAYWFVARFLHLGSPDSDSPRQIPFKVDTLYHRVLLSNKLNLKLKGFTLWTAGRTRIDPEPQIVEQCGSLKV